MNEESLEECKNSRSNGKVQNIRELDCEHKTTQEYYLDNSPTLFMVAQVGTPIVSPSFFTGTFK